MKKWIPALLFLFFSILFSCPQKINAAPSQLSSGVVLSEVLANAHGAYEQGLEFIELLNTTDSKVDISELTLTITDPDRGQSVTQNLIDFVGFNDVSKENYYLEIPSGGYALIVDPRYKGQYNNQIKQFSGYNLIMITVDANYLGFGSLPNDRATVTVADSISSVSFSWDSDPGDGVSFEYDPAFSSWSPSGNFYGASPGYDNQDPPVAKISAKNYLGKAPFSINFQSESFDPEKTNLSYLWDFDDGTKTSVANPSHTFTKQGQYEVVLYVWDALGLQGSDILEVNVLPKGLVISEVYPNPKGPDDGFEFVELYNGSGETVNLDNWQIRDSAGNGVILKNEKIKPKSFRVFSGNFYLNNSGEDSANLYYSGGKLLVDSFKYKNAPSGESLALINGKTVWTTLPTPDKANILKLFNASFAYSKAYSPVYKKSSFAFAKANNTFYQPAKVKGITLAATNNSIYPLGKDFRGQRDPQNLSKVGDLFGWLALILIVLALILTGIYFRMIGQEKSARSP